jgi:hypothetical protein
MSPSFNPESRENSPSKEEKKALLKAEFDAKMQALDNDLDSDINVSKIPDIISSPQTKIEELKYKINKEELELRRLDQNDAHQEILLRKRYTITTLKNELSALQPGKTDIETYHKHSDLATEKENKHETYSKPDEGVKTLKNIALIGGGLTATMLGGIKVISEMPQQSAQMPHAPVENTSPTTAVSPEERQAPIVSALENSQEQFSQSLNLDYMSPQGTMNMDLGSVQSVQTQDKKKYENLLNGKEALMLPIQSINGKLTMQILARGGMPLTLFVQKAEGGTSYVTLNNTQNLSSGAVFIYTINISLLTTKIVFIPQDGSTTRFITDRSTVSVRTAANGMTRTLDSFQYLDPSSVNTNNPSRQNTPATQAPAQTQKPSEEKTCVSNICFEDFH